MIPALQHLSDDSTTPLGAARWPAAAATLADPARSRNRLLAALAAGDPAGLGPLLPQLERRTVAEGELLLRQGAPITDLWFPETAVVVTRLAGEDGGEVGIVGCEGMVGLPALLGAGRADADMVVRVAGSAVRLDAAALRLTLARSAALRAVVERYTQALLERRARAALCNRSHAINQRLALLLLEVQDCVGAERFPLTHEQLASMLGVRRAGVTEAATRLRSAGAIDYQRGQVVVRDRVTLEAKACGCYAAEREHGARKPE